MSAPAAVDAAWIQSAGALVLLAVAAHCAARLVQASRAAARADAASHAADLLMALGLAAMLSPLGNPIPAAAGEAAFGLVVAGSLAAALGAGESGRRLAWARHAVAGAAMVYTFAAMPAGMSGMDGMSVAQALLTWTLVAYFAAAAAWSAVAAARGVAPGVSRVTAATSPPRPAAAMVLAPPVTSLCHAAMAISMVYLLPAMR